MIKTRAVFEALTSVILPLPLQGSMLEPLTDPLLNGLQTSDISYFWQWPWT